MNHKEKCKCMKAMRKDIADQLGIDLHQTECTYAGECSGTCPKCAKEERILSKALLKGSLAIASVAISSVALTGCGSNTSGGDDPDDKNISIHGSFPWETSTEDDLEGEPILIEGDTTEEPYEGGLDGDVEYIEPTTENTTEYELDGDVVVSTEEDIEGMVEVDTEETSECQGPDCE